MAMALILFLGFWAVIIILSGLRVIKQFETGILFTLGKFSKTLNPGLNFVLPIFQTMTKIDMRVTVVDVPEQDCISKCPKKLIGKATLLLVRESCADKISPCEMCKKLINK